MKSNGRRESYKANANPARWALVVGLQSFAAVALSAEFPAKETSAPLAEVLVTAQRRAEEQQSIPLAVAALSGKQLMQAGASNAVSLSLAVPGLMYMQGANASTPFIRGIGTTTNSAGAEASVATYVDGTYVSSATATLFEFSDVERVEILKGPQGTLFGRNATGGVVHIITKDPAFVPFVEANVGYANFETTSASFYGTLPVTDEVAVSLSAYGRDQVEGWGTNLVTGQPTFTRRDFGTRSKVLWLPSAKSRITLAADYNRARNQDGLGYHLLPSALGSDGTSGYRGFYNTYDDPNDYSDVRQAGVSLTAQHDWASSRLVSITAWRNVDAFMQFDQDATPIEIVTAPISQHARTVTQELQLLSGEGASIPWIAGLYYYDDFSSYDPLALRGKAVAPADERQIWSSQRSKSYAAFGQFTPEIATDTHLTLGTRYTRDERDVSGRTLALSGANVSALTSATDSASWSKVTWRVAVDHRFNDEVMAFVSADRGFKSGIYNLVSYAAPPVRPETLDAYQLGVKTQWLDHRLRLNATAFYYDYEDMQVQKLVTGTTLLLNAAGAVIKGLDADATIAVSEALTLRGGVGLARGRYTDFYDAPFFFPALDLSGRPVGGNRQVIGDASDLHTVRTPEQTANLGVDYRAAALGGDVNFAVNYYYNGGFAWDPDNRLQQSSYQVANASIEWTAPGNAWSVRLWSRNLTNAHFCAYAAARPFLDSCSPAPPRTYGVTFSARYRP